MNSHLNHGVFTISLDFELYWGMSCIMKEENYIDNLKGTPGAIDQILHLFEQYNIHATWATVGLLFHKSVNDLKLHIPKQLPTYNKAELNNYLIIDEIKKSNINHYFAPNLIKAIATTSNQEIATHTYSHFYCLEQGQTKEDFKFDLEKAIAIASQWGIAIKSIVFPRNQCNEKYIIICKQLGIENIRGTPSHYLYKARPYDDEKGWLMRLWRLGDSYFNLTSDHSFRPSSTQNIWNIKGSRFLRPYHPKLSFLENLKLKRIKNEMTQAAKTNKVYHLWWHPHNFGIHTIENISFLQKILTHYLYLKNNYAFKSLNMQELGTELAKQQSNEKENLVYHH